MFVRKKRNPTGSISVQVIDKSSGKYRVYKTLGNSKDSAKIELLIQAGRVFIEECRNNSQKLLTVKTKEELVIEKFCKELGNHNIRTIGPELIFGKLFDHIGFNVVPKKLFRHLVIARLAYPTSKLKTIDYLLRYRPISRMENPSLSPSLTVCGSL